MRRAYRHLRLQCDKCEIRPASLTDAVELNENSLAIPQLRKWEGVKLGAGAGFESLTLTEAKSRQRRRLRFEVIVSERERNCTKVPKSKLKNIQKHTRWATFGQPIVLPSNVAVFMPVPLKKCFARLGSFVGFL